ncbi:uncharacterized protein [Rutidosis leptorrhynchoides]|uniref:uncharacterized protein n=1 Tax=Rutidosis leptorrhynchoides TaxID=125765 RepID=UPI003A98D277
MARNLMDQITQREKKSTTVKAKTTDGKRKWDGNSNQHPYKRQDVTKGSAGESTKGYKGKLLYCQKVCYECGQKGNFRNNCPNKKTNEKAQGRAFNSNAHEAREDPELVTGTFLHNNHIVSVLFDFGANRSFVSIEFSCMIDKTHKPLATKYCIKLVNGNLMKTDKIYKILYVALRRKTIFVDLMPIELGSFDVVVGMYWLSNNKSELVYAEKAIRIPLDNGETMMVYGDRTDTKLNLISCMKARKYLKKGYHDILANVKKIEPREKRIADVPIVKDFPNIFPEELHGLPPH